MRDPRRRLRVLLTTLWRDIPSERNGFANNVIQAASTATPEEGYNPTLLNWVEEQIAAMISDTLAPGRRKALDSACFAHILMMAQDGFVINYRLQPDNHCSDETIDFMCRLVLDTGPTAKRPGVSR